MRLLLVEDEEKVGRYLRKGLTESGFSVDIAHDGEEGLFSALANPYDLAILDVMLPKRDGFSVLREIRKADRKFPVIMLTARDAVEDRVRGIELGADIYLVKPFSFSELLAYIRSLLNRSQTSNVDVEKIADLEIDFRRQRVRRGGAPIDLTAKEFSLLSLFVRRKGQILSRALIADEVWGMSFDCDTNVVDVHIRRLRVKMDEPFERKLIHTVRGAGYVLDDTIQ